MINVRMRKRKLITWEQGAVIIIVCFWVAQKTNFILRYTTNHKDRRCLLLVVFIVMCKKNKRDKSVCR